MSKQRRVTLKLLTLLLCILTACKENHNLNGDKDHDETAKKLADAKRIAAIKRKNGQITQGRIQGYLVQKNGGETKGSGQFSYYATYVLTFGEFIEAIDEDGIHVSSFSYVIVVNSESPFEDEEVIGKADKIADTQDEDFGFSLSPGIRMVAKVNPSKMLSKAGKPIDDPSLVQFVQGCEKLPLIGACTMPGYAINPVLEVDTGNGVVKIAINEIVSFNQTTGYPSQKSKK